MSPCVPIRVLILDGFSNHDWPRTTRLIHEILRAAGRFVVTISTAPETGGAAGWDKWRPDFSNSDVVLQTCNDYGGGPAWPQEVRRSFDLFVREGGGLYVFHSANNAFPDWPEYDRMIGLGWRKIEQGSAVSVANDGRLLLFPAGKGAGTGHAPRREVTVVRRGDHELHRDLPRQWRSPLLEIYQFVRGPAQELEVISFAYDEPTGMNWPIEWTVRHGQGRIYNSTFGHIWPGDENTEGLRCSGVQTMMVRALQWLAGQPVDREVPADFPTSTAVSLRPWSDT